MLNNCAESKLFRRLRTVAALMLGLYVLVFPRVGFSHVNMRTVSNAFLVAGADTVDYYVTVPPFIANLLGDGKDLTWYGNYFGQYLKIKTQQSPCAPETVYPIAAQASGYQIIHIAYHCPKHIQDLSVQSDGLFTDIDSTHTQFIRLVPASDPRHVLAESILSSAHPSWHIANATASDSGWLDHALAFFQLGVRHILTGYDHILFLLSVILVSASFLETLKLVTSFTLAHSITLALAFFGVVSLPGQVVEPLIALTIVYVAFENLLVKSFKRRWLLTFAFGLVHGLGFVDALKEISVSKNELLTSLVSFNLGIEAGQLIIVSAAMFVLSWMAASRWRLPMLRAMSVVIGLFGLVWFVQRVSGLV